MKGVIVCAGKSSRLFPATSRISKQLLPLYDKPLMYYPVGMLMKAGIKDIAIVTNKENEQLFIDQFKISDLGVNFQIFADENPRGAAASMTIAKDFVGDESFCLVLGDNFFYGDDFEKQFKDSLNLTKGASVFSYEVNNAQNFGVISADKNNKIIKIVEKPAVPESKKVITGIYIFDKNAMDYTKLLKPSKRNEIELTDLINIYLDKKQLGLIPLSKKNYWLDAGTPQGMLEASIIISKIQKKTKKIICCLEEIAYLNAFINKEQLRSNYEKLKKSDYGKYLEKYL